VAATWHYVGVKRSDGGGEIPDYYAIPKRSWPVIKLTPKKSGCLAIRPDRLWLLKIWVVALLKIYFGPAQRNLLAILPLPNWFIASIPKRVFEYH